jgi:hypothetical protein
MSADERVRRGEEAFRYGLENFSVEANVGKLESALEWAMRSPAGP